MTILKNPKFSPGFTLSEMLVAIAISLIIIASLATVYYISQKSFKSGSSKIDLSQNARIGLDKISRELRQTNSVISTLPPTGTDSSNPPATEIAFQNATSSQIQYIDYHIVSNNLNRKVYHYYSGSSSNWVSYNTSGATYQLDQDLTIANNIASIQFYGQSTITIILKAQFGSDSVQLQDEISPRNLS
jgi:prepilin-type N-terminal cleavage/methylation domain-containing protein